MKSPERRGPRLELKFLLDAQRATEIFQWAQARMAADPHARDPQDPIYTVESIYFDTPMLDCLRGRGTDRLPKYRARRYNGNGQSIFLEEKLRRQQQVWKRRPIQVPLLGHSRRTRPKRAAFRKREGDATRDRSVRNPWRRGTDQRSKLWMDGASSMAG